MGYKTEKEKMLAHQWYDANFDKDLETERVRAKDLCFDFNQTRQSDDSRRQAILTELFGYTLENVAINSPFDTDYGWNVKLGKMCLLIVIVTSWMEVASRLVMMYL